MRKDEFIEFKLLNPISESLSYLWFNMNHHCLCLEEDLQKLRVAFMINIFDNIFDDFTIPKDIDLVLEYTFVDKL